MGRSRLLARLPRPRLVPRTVFFPCGEWLPDQPDFNNPGASTITNVVPKTADPKTGATTYGPMPTPVAYSSALTARCQGSYTVQDDSGAAQLFAGDATKLYNLNTGLAATWANVSRLAGGTYTTPALPDSFWSYTSFGKRVIATNFADAVQSYLVGTDTNFSALAAGAPKAKFCAVIRDFLMLGYLSVGGTVYPNRVQWSAIGDPTSWPVVNTDAAKSVQSDQQDLQQTDLGPITGIVGGHLSSADGAIWCERGIWSVRYQPGPVFNIQVAEGAAGTLSPLSLIPCRITAPGGSKSVVCYVGEDFGFKAFDGATSASLGGQKVDAFFAADLDASYAGQILGVNDPASKLIYWFYCAAGSGGLYNRAICYNTEINRFSYINLTDYPLEWADRSLSIGVTLEGLDAFSSSIDTLAFSLDSRVWIGGKPNFAVFNSSHMLAYLTGSNLAATVETSEGEFARGRRGKALSARPMCTGNSITPSVAVAVRDRQQDSAVYGSAVAMNIIGECPQRVTGRYGRFRMTLPAASDFGHLQGVMATVAPEGLR